jgi:hypothetical protein
MVSGFGFGQSPSSQSISATHGHFRQTSLDGILDGVITLFTPEVQSEHPFSVQYYYKRNWGTWRKPVETSSVS